MPCRRNVMMNLDATDFRRSCTCFVMGALMPCQIDPADELARLRAEVERLTAALADERRHADALADTLYSMDGLQSIDCEMRDNAVQQHRARRQG